MFFRCFLGVFEPKTPSLSYFEGGSKGGFGQKNRFLVNFWPQNNMVPNHSRDIAELLAVVWSMNDVCEAQKMHFLDTLKLEN